MTILGWLVERMRGWRDRPAMIWRDQAFSYGSLLDSMAVWKRQLDTVGLKAGRGVSLEGDYSPKTVALLLALIDHTAIIIPLTKAMEAHGTEFIDIAEAEVLINFDAA